MEMKFIVPGSDGVVFVSSGCTSYYYDLHGKAVAKLDGYYIDKLGNRFYTNCEKKEAKEIIKELANEGKEAIVEAALKTNPNVKYPKNLVAIYIVEKKAELSPETDEISS